MDIETQAEEVAELYRGLYQYLYRRRDPQAYRPSGETLAVLHHLAATGPLTIAEAASHFDRSQAATSELIARLMRRGLLDRWPDERDRRRHLVWLTEEGRVVLRDETQVLSHRLLGAVLRRLDENERSQIVAGMRALFEAAKAYAQERTERDARREDLV
jgi:DNA-binding MarR family transcriptional regulator